MTDPIRWIPRPPEKERPIGGGDIPPPTENVRQAICLYDIYFPAAPSTCGDAPSASLGPVDLVIASGQELATAFGTDTDVDSERVLPSDIPTHGKNVSRGGEIV